MRGLGGIRTLVVAGLVAIGAAACDPPLPRLALTVDSTAAGGDDAPGDGVCSSAAAGGACTLQAAIEEGNLAPDGADLTVPDGHYRINATVTGDLRVNPGAPAGVTITDSTVTVAAGGRLSLAGVNTSTGIQAGPPSTSNPATSVSLLRLSVAGSADVARSILGGVDVAAGGAAVLADSVVESAAVTNGGDLVAIRSSLLGPAQNGPAATVLTTGAGAASNLASSVVAVPHTTVVPFAQNFAGGQGSCAGPAPVSASYVFVEVPCGATGGTGDGSGDARTTMTSTFTFTGLGYRQIGNVHGLQATSPLVDAIPVGTAGCELDAVDVYGNPRGVDGNGDGIGGCDIGAVERQP